MYQFSGICRSFFDPIAIDQALMGVNDILAVGALPVGYHDEVVAKTSDWFNDQKRAEDYARGVFEVCQLCGMALVGGESPAYRFLLGATPPVSDTPSLSCAVFGIIAPASRRINEKNLRPGDIIIGATSSGWHSNGATYIIEEALKLPDGFNAKLPDGRTLGEHALTPTRSYVALMDAWLEAELEIHAFQPITGGGVAKIAFDKRPFTYRIKDWPKKIPPIFTYMREQFGLSVMGSLTTFNNGIGAVGFFPRSAVQKAMDVGIKAGYEMYELGVVEEGERQTIFGPENDLVLPPPGD
ncbi:MAG: AIR synthase related protein [Patescibacteria group bacterium]|nr:AIR synthase related protein [Patescibacteria group bacterium]MDD5294587.1 AIR synthase related protein [Patescibacteria group bacterium]MDD5554097.1 AIR synthase related protein [Patescibacteria group bacterium]